MKNLYLFPVLVLIFSYNLCDAQKKHTLSITYIQPYCGGARPTEEMELEAQTSKPFEGMRVVLFGNGRKAKVLKTGLGGKLILKLKNGEYKLMEYWRYAKLGPNGQAAGVFDPLCLEQEWKKEFIRLVVKDGKMEVTEMYQLSMFCPHTMPCVLDVNLPPMRE